VELEQNDEKNIENKNTNKLIKSNSNSNNNNNNNNPSVMIIGGGMSFNLALGTISRIC